jgi:hypothetical protein
MEPRAERKRLYSWLRYCLIGEGLPDEHLIQTQPLDRCHTGILFPLQPGEYGEDVAAEPDEAADDDTPVNAQRVQPAGNLDNRRFVPPSSVGFSFYISGGSVQLQLIASAMRYRLENESDDQAIPRQQDGRFATEWRRERLGGTDGEAHDCQAPRQRRVTSERIPVFLPVGEKTALAQLLLLWRPLHDGWLVTASLSNTQRLAPPLEANATTGRARAVQRNQLALFEVGLRCVIDAGVVGPYPGQSFADLTQEEQELELQYQTHRVYAVGHGAAVEWELGTSRSTASAPNSCPLARSPR